MGKINEKRKIKEFAYEKHDFILKYIANKVGWHYESETDDQYASVNRIPTSIENHKYQFCMWYRNGEFLANSGYYNGGYSERRHEMNDYSIADIILMMNQFEIKERRREIDERKLAILGASSEYEA
jgi:hypothetical protein